MKVNSEQVLQAARAVEAKSIKEWGQVTPWTGVSLYIHMFPNETRYRTKEFGITAQLAKLKKQGVVEPFPGFEKQCRLTK